MNRKISLLIIAGFCLIVLLLIVLVTKKQKGKIDFSGGEYRTDIEPLRNHFPLLQKSSIAHWKSGSYGKLSFGLSDVWLKGFVLLDDETHSSVKSAYTWEKIDVSIDEAVNPSITGFDDFEWYSSDEFSRYMNDDVFMGVYFLDIKNKVLYFDVSTY